MSTLSRRNLFGLTAGAVVTAGLSACAGSGGSSSGGNNGGGDSNTIEFWSNHPGKSKATEQKLIAEFEKANPNLKVKLVDAGKSYPDVAQKFNAALSGGSLPDVVIVSDTTWFNFALNDRLADMSALTSENKLSTDDYVKGLYDDYKYEDKHYALPYSRSTVIFYYNKDAWKKAGLPDRAPTSWDEFEQWAPKLQSAMGSGKKAIVLDDGSDYLDWTFQSIAWSYGGGYSKDWTPTMASEGTVKAATKIQEWAKKGWMQTSKDSQADFASGIGACAIESTGGLAGVIKDASFKVGIGFLPAPGGIKTVPTGGAGLAVPKGISAERQKNAVKFIEFMTNKDNTITFSQATGYMPVRTSAMDDAKEKAYLEKNPEYAVAVKQLPKARPQDNVRVFLPGGGIDIGTSLDKIIAGSDVKSTLEALDKALQAKYDSQIKPKLKK
ncbi:MULTISPECIES: ABC transporter substrate-binding protein [Dermacoccus]|uniref:ABC transporter substrate-binding protein n=1 Tax=Dermacoccus TaxID=57495 RepID=UPI00078398CA|nr:MULTISPECIES: ABC transporter substrate-binding protein [Dermacoccus]NHC32878.1 ABC transporter substrate-binding protein [Dermacoccus nishinomiyaensis]TCJ91294.1 carbohydrate ABC transporter substrate-binding protein (CUT1 family) [Dermacoccus sp. SAI-028]